MLTEFASRLSSDLIMGLAQAGAAIALCMCVMLLCRWFSVKVERETMISLGRGLFQMTIVGIVLTLLLKRHFLVSIAILIVMTIAAAYTASRRARGLQNTVILSFYSIGAGSAIVIASMLATRVLKTDISILVPIGSMIIASTMNACAQSIERFRSDVSAHIGQIESALALGAEPAAAVSGHVQNAVYASLLPRLDMLKSLGIVWIPGVMAGMLVSGGNPVYSGIYQFIVVAMMLSASGITALVATLLIRKRAFTPAAQLLIR